MRTISFTITGQGITGTAISDLVGNTKNYVEASFTFSSEWEGFFKIAIFTANGKQYPAILENNKCMVPDVAMSGDYMDVGVMAGYNGTTLSTDTFRVRIEESVRTKPPYDLITMFDGLSDDIADLQAEDDVLDAKIDLKQAKLLETPIEIDGVEYATVEAALIASCAHAGSFDSALSSTSENAVQNKVVKAAMDEKQGKTLDNSITIDGSTYTTVETAIAAIIGAIPTVDATLDASSTNAIQNKAVYAGLAAKVTSALSSALTIDGVSKTSVEDALTALAGHTGNSVLSAAGIHNIRYYNSKLQGYNTTTGQWSDIVAGGSGDEERLDAIDQNILALTLALSIYQQAEVEGMANNIVVEVFDDTSGYVLVKGAFDSTNHQVYA